MYPLIDLRVCMQKLYNASVFETIPNSKSEPILRCQIGQLTSRGSQGIVIFLEELLTHGGVPDDQAHDDRIGAMAVELSKARLCATTIPIW